MSVFLYRILARARAWMSPRGGLGVLTCSSLNLLRILTAVSRWFVGVLMRYVCLLRVWEVVFVGVMLQGRVKRQAARKTSAGLL